MTRRFRIAVGSYLCVSLWAGGACFPQAPSVGEGSSDGSDDGSGSATSGASMPNDASGSPTTAPDGSAGSEDSTGCTLDCQPASGEPLWTVVQDEENNIGIYTVAVTAEGDIVAGGAVLDADDHASPWLGRYAPDGTLLWTEAMPAASGNAHYRGLVALDDGRVLGVGGIDTSSDTDPAWLRAWSPSGDVVWEYELQTIGGPASLLGVVPRSDGGLIAVGTVTDANGSRPFVVGFDPEGDGWQPGITSEDIGEYLDTIGAMFSIVADDDGYLIVGFTQQEMNGPSDAAVWRIDANGYSMGLPATFGGEGDDDFVDIVKDGEVVHVLGRTGSGSVSTLWLARLTVGDSVTIAWEETWSELAFNVGNGLAVRDGVRYVAASTNISDQADGFESRVLRWDGDENAPTWVVPFADPSPGLDYAADVAIAPDGTVVAVGPVTPEDGSSIDAWIRKMAP